MEPEVEEEAEEEEVEFGTGFCWKQTDGRYEAPGGVTTNGAGFGRLNLL